uniref:Uncharacterized protein n=1 Tax=Biomphalaria glabrata TaxID=6526 RepID=A0A2C9K8P4_BIOGL
MFRYLLCCIPGPKQNTVKCVRDVSVIFPPVASTQAEQKDVFDENSVENNMFPWLTEKFLSRTRFRAFTKDGDGDLCRAKSIYKFLAPFKSTEISQSVEADWLPVWMAASVDGCQCGWLPVWMAASVDGCQCG